MAEKYSTCLEQHNLKGKISYLNDLLTHCDISQLGQLKSMVDQLCDRINTEVIKTYNGSRNSMGMPRHKSFYQTHSNSMTDLYEIAEESPEHAQSPVPIPQEKP